MKQETSQPTLGSRTIIKDRVKWTGLPTRMTNLRLPGAYLLAGMIYLGASLWLTGILHHGVTNQFMNESGDPNVYVFFLKWWPWAISHGQNPFNVRALTFPVVYNAAWLTSIPGPAILASPITALWGPIASWNILIVLAPVAAAESMFSLLKTIGLKTIASVLGGLVFGFSAYEAGQMSGHLFLTLSFPFPLLAMIVIQRLKGNITAKVFVSSAVVVVSFIFYTSIELALTACITGAAVLVALMVRYRATFVQTCVQFWREAVAAIIGVGLVTSPLLYYLVLGLRIGRSSINSPVIFSTDLLNFIIPTQYTAVSLRALSSISERFTGNLSEQGGYIGLVILLIVVMAIAEALPRDRWVAPLGIVFGALGIATLGPYLHVNGVVTGIELPWRLVAGLPIFDNILPSRLMLYVSLFSGFWVAVWVSHGHKRTGYWMRAVLAMLGVALVFPNPSLFYYSVPNIPAAVSNGQLAAFVGSRTGVFIVPQNQALAWSDGNVGALWSQASDFKLKVTNAPWGYDPYSAAGGFSSWPVVELSSGLRPSAGSILQLEMFCSSHSDGVVAVPSYEVGWIRALSMLGWEQKSFRGVAAFRVPKAEVAQKSRHSA